MANQLQIKDIIDIHKNIPAVIDCFGPSGNNNRDKIDKLHKDKKIIRFSCNDWWRHLPDSPFPDYWVMASSVDRIDKYQSQINQYKIPVLYAYSIDRSNKNIIKDLDCPFILGYDQKHLNGNLNGEWCCHDGCVNTTIKGNLTIQQELQNLSGTERYGSGDSVVFHMIAFALLMGCNSIYLNGVDLDYRLGYANSHIRTHNDPLWQECADRQIDNFNLLNNAANALNRRIYNLNHNSWYGIFNNGFLSQIS